MRRVQFTGRAQFNSMAKSLEQELWSHCQQQVYSEVTRAVVQSPVCICSCISHFCATVFLLLLVHVYYTCHWEHTHCVFSQWHMCICSCISPLYDVIYVHVMLILRGSVMMMIILWSDIFWWCWFWGGKIWWWSYCDQIWSGGRFWCDIQLIRGKLID